MRRLEDDETETCPSKQVDHDEAVGDAPTAAAGRLLPERERRLFAWAAGIPRPTAHRALGPAEVPLFAVRCSLPRLVRWTLRLPKPRPAGAVERRRAVRWLRARVLRPARAAVDGRDAEREGYGGLRAAAGGGWRAARR